MNFYIRLDDDQPYQCSDLVEVATHLAGESYASDFIVKSGGITSNGMFASLYVGTNGQYERDLTKTEIEELRHLIEEVVFEDEA